MMAGSSDTQLAATAIDSVARAWAVVVVATCKENLSIDSVAAALRPRLQGVEALFARAHEDRLRDLQERLRWLTREVCKAAGVRGDVEVAAVLDRIRELRATKTKRKAKRKQKARRKSK
jgi:hypothetical protein